MATDWETYLPDVLLEAPGCPTIIAVQAIRSAAIELCQQSSVWQEDLARADLVAANPLCTLAVPAGSEIATILDVQFYAVGQTTGVPVTGPVDEMALNALRPGWKDEATTGTLNGPEVCGYPTPLTLRLIPIPVVNQTAAIAVTAALRPTRASLNGPDLLYTEYLETITTGALAKLMAMNKKPWTDLEMAVDKRGSFGQLKAAAAGRKMRAADAMPMTVYARTLA